LFAKKLGVNPQDKLDNSIEDYLPLVKAIIQMENGMQPYDDELLVEGMYKAWDGFPTGSNKVY
jgi:DNA-directed RNA polymerase specialized sigma subunit